MGRILAGPGREHKLLGISCWLSSCVVKVKTYQWGPVKSDVRKLKLTHMQHQFGEEFVQATKKACNQELSKNDVMYSVYDKRLKEIGETIFDKIDTNKDGAPTAYLLHLHAHSKVFSTGKLSLEEVKVWAEANHEEAEKFIFKWVKKKENQAAEEKVAQLFGETNNDDLKKTEFAKKYVSAVNARNKRNQSQFALK